MLKQFYEKALPSQGVYCATAIDPVTKKAVNKFAETLDDLFSHIDKMKANKQNTFIALGSFDGFSRKAEDCLYLRSFFIDIDVGESKDYLTKEEAHAALHELIDATGLPDPMVVDSGGGVHAYWIMDEDIPKDEWKVFAEKFKSLCLEHIKIDPKVSADAARVLRCIDTLNYKFDPPRLTELLNDELQVYSYETFKEFLGEDTPVNNILAAIPKGLDEETRSIAKTDNYESDFMKIAERSLEGSGCNQIKHFLENPNSISYDEWFSGLSIAKFCANGDEMIHLFSEDYKGYDRQATIDKAAEIEAPHRCEQVFAANWPDRCKGCKHRGKINTPIQLGKTLKSANPASNPNIETDKTESVRAQSDTQKVPDFPDFLKPYVRGMNGGVYFNPPPKVGKDGKTHYEDPIMVSAHDLYPIARLYSHLDGECLQMRLVLPFDGDREFLMPMKSVYAQDKFKEIMSSNGVLFSPKGVEHLMSYIVKWGQYFVSTQEAQQMRQQMGWTVSTDDPDVFQDGSFVVGAREISAKGIEEVPVSPYCRGVAKHLVKLGSFDKWKTSAQALDEEGFEMHAFGMLCGFASPIIGFTSTSGVVVSFQGKSGSAKTGSLYAALSVWGNPKELSVFDATDNAMIGRYLALKNMMLGVDETSNTHPKALAQLIHRVSHGKAKLKMQGSVNAEREYEMFASLIGFFTTNQSVYSALESFKGRPDGEAARCIEFLIHKPKPLAVNGRRGKEIFDVFRKNYGHASEPYLSTIYAKWSHERITDRTEYWVEKFRSDFGVLNEYRYYENLVGAVFTAGEIVNETGMIHLNLDRIYHVVVREMIIIRDKVIKLNHTDYDVLLGEFMNKYQTGMLAIKDNKIHMEPRTSLVGRAELNENMVYISKPEFRKFLNEKQISSREFEFEMKEKGILKVTKKKKLGAGWKEAMSSHNVEVYGFETQIPDEWLLSKDEDE